LGEREVLRLCAFLQNLKIFVLNTINNQHRYILYIWN
jgi:hypothetical protein